MAKTKFHVEMTCGGCEKAVRKALDKQSGVDNVEINLDEKLVVVEGSADPNTLLEAIKKTGKAVNMLPN